MLIYQNKDRGILQKFKYRDEISDSNFREHRDVVIFWREDEISPHLKTTQDQDVEIKIRAVLCLLCVFFQAQGAFQLVTVDHNSILRLNAHYILLAAPNKIEVSNDDYIASLVAIFLY